MIPVFDIFVFIGLLTNITSSAGKTDFLRILRQRNSSFSFFNSGSTGGGTGNSAPMPQQFIDPSFQSTVGGASPVINGSSGTFLDPSAFLNLGNSQFSNVGSGASSGNGISGTNQLQKPGNMSNPMLFISPGIFNNFQNLNFNGGSTSVQQSRNQSQTGGESTSGGTLFSTIFFQPSKFFNPGAFLFGKRKRRS